MQSIKNRRQNRAKTGIIYEKIGFADFKKNVTDGEEGKKIERWEGRGIFNFSFP